MTKLIVIMVDGVSADYFRRNRRRLPNLDRLAQGGRTVERLAPDVPATSLPGRTSIVTGVDCATHGIFGNVIWDGERFRYANPDDVRVPTLPRVARDAGLDVAVFGYGMIRPEDATTFHHAWWANEMLQRARDEDPIPADEGWLRTSRHRDASGRLDALHARGLPGGVPDAYAGDRFHYFASELAGDATMLQWTAGAATADDAPDVIFTEVLTPDTVQHMAGYESDFAHWSIHYADALVGTLLATLTAAGRTGTDRPAVVVMSDHGHGPVERALHPERIAPGLVHVNEGGFLHVALEGTSDARALERAFAPYGVARAPSEHVPTDVRSQVATFVAPPRTTFERAPDDREEAQGAPRYASGHGFAPGAPSDDRFLVANGPGIAAGSVDRAASESVAATLAALLELEWDTPSSPSLV